MLHKASHELKDEAAAAALRVLSELWVPD